MTQQANTSKLVTSLGKIITYARSRNPSPVSDVTPEKPTLGRKPKKKPHSKGVSRWSEFLKRTRGAKFRSAREFFAEIGEAGRTRLGVSYAQYSRYEGGQGLPPLEWVTTWATFFEIPLQTAVQEWLMAQLHSLPTETSAALVASFETAFEVPKPAVASAATPSAVKSYGLGLDDMLIFNRSHLPLFTRGPWVRDLIVFCYARNPHWISIDELNQTFPNRDLGPLLRELTESGVLVQSGEDPSLFHAGKKLHYFPEDRDFFAVKNQNVRHNVDQILDGLRLDQLQQGEALRLLLSRRWSGAQFQKISRALNQVFEEAGREEAVDAPLGEASDAKSSSIYSLCLVFGKRFE